MKNVPPPLKIVVSGPTGSGKTTFVRALAQKMNVPILEENMKDIYQAHDRFIQARKNKVFQTQIWQRRSNSRPNLLSHGRM